MKPNKHETEREELKRRLDALIGHYEKYGGPQPGAPIQVDCFASDLTFATVDLQGRILYRGYVLLPVKRKEMSKREFQQRHGSL